MTQIQIISYKLVALVLLKMTFLTALSEIRFLSRSPDSSLLETAFFFFYSKNSLDCSSLADQKPQSFIYILIQSFPPSSFDYPMNQHPVTLAL